MKTTGFSSVIRIFSVVRISSVYSHHEIQLLGQFLSAHAVTRAGMHADRDIPYLTMDLGRSMSSTLLHSPIMLTMKTIDAVTSVTLLAMLKITRPYMHWQSIRRSSAISISIIRLVSIIDSHPILIEITLLQCESSIITDYQTLLFG